MAEIKLRQIPFYEKFNNEKTRNIHISFNIINIVNNPGPVMVPNWLSKVSQKCLKFQFENDFQTFEKHFEHHMSYVL